MMKLFVLVAAPLLLMTMTTDAFTPQPTSVSRCWRPTDQRTTLKKSNNNEEFDRKVRLREEAESPFQKVRYLIYANLGGGALISLFLSVTRIAAGLNGINTELLQESEVNAAVDLAGLVVIGFLWKREKNAEEARIKRATKGAELASLNIRAAKKLADGLEEDLSETFVTPLSSLRRGRGIEKRVVIVAAGVDKIQQVLNEAERLKDSLILNDLLIVPVILPQGIAPDPTGDTPECIALPVGNNWKSVVDDETEEARNQGINVEAEGIAITLKKNGRVGQRTKGVYLDRMVGEVVSRREAGMDVTNI